MGELLIHRRVPRVLVVDDNPDMAELMRELLASRGYDVFTVRDADEAEIEVRRHLPDLILSDVVMPGRSGYELCRQLKEDPATRLIPFLLITGLSDREDKVKGIEAGADDFLNKPIFPAELFARVKSLLKLKEFTDELETAESVLCTLGRSVEARDPYTEGHCERLSNRAVLLGRHLGLDEESLIALRRGGYLHDLGKIAVPDEILKKGSNLTPDEWKVMKQHPADGREHLQAAEVAAPGAAHHPLPSRTLRRQRLSRRPHEKRNSAPAPHPASRRRLRRPAHHPPLQNGPVPRASRTHHASRSAVRPLGRRPGKPILRDAGTPPGRLTHPHLSS